MTATAPTMEDTASATPAKPKTFSEKDHTAHKVLAVIGFTVSTIAALSFGKSVGAIITGYAGLSGIVPLAGSAVIYWGAQTMAKSYTKLAWPDNVFLLGKDATPKDIVDAVPSADELKTTTDDIKQEISRLSDRIAELSQQVAPREEGPKKAPTENAPRP